MNQAKMNTLRRQLSRQLENVLILTSTKYFLYLTNISYNTALRMKESNYIISSQLIEVLKNAPIRHNTESVRNTLDKIEDLQNSCEGYLISKLRKANNLTQTQLAELAGVGTTTIVNAEKHTDTLTLYTFHCILSALNITPGQFYTKFEKQQQQ